MKASTTTVVAVVSIAFAAVNISTIFNAIFRAASFPLDPTASSGTIEPTSDAELTQRVRGKNALVVGGTKGIGSGIALQLARAGAHVLIVGRSNGESVVERMRAVAPAGTAAASQRLLAASADLSTSAGCKSLVTALSRGRDRSGDDNRFDFIFFTVGVWPDWDDPFTMDGVERVVAIDLRARHLVLQGLAKTGALAPGARIVNTLAPTQRFPFLSEADIRQRLSTARTAAPSNLYAGLMPVAVAADAWLRVAVARLQADHGVALGAALSMFPGLIATGLHEQSFRRWPMVSALLTHAMRPVAITAEASGRAHLDIITSPKLTDAATVFANHLRETRLTHPLAYDEQLGEFVYDFLEQDCRADI